MRGFFPQCRNFIRVPSKAKANDTKLTKIRQKQDFFWPTFRCGFPHWGCTYGWLDVNQK